MGIVEGRLAIKKKAADSGCNSEFRKGMGAWTSEVPIALMG